MQYYDDNDRTGKRTAILATVLYLVLVTLLLLFVKINFDTSETGEGILVDFGDTEQAGGSIALSSPAETASDRPRNDTPPVLHPDEIMTQDYEEAPEIPRTQQRPEPRPSENEQREPQRQASAAEEPVREVDSRALFPGSSSQNTSSSQGTSEGEGRQGSESGTPGGDPSGTGTGSGGTGFSLSGRSIVGTLPQPKYGPNKQGRVIVDITVDANGNVIRAIPRGQGSTTNDSELVSAAIKAAGEARFNVVEGDGLQNGTITYNFILK